MIVLFTGISGIHIIEALEKFASNFKEFRTDRNLRPIVIKFDELVKEAYLESNPGYSYTAKSLWINKILKEPYSELKKYWYEAFDKLLDKIEMHKGSHIFLNMHVCYFHNKTQEYLSLIDVELIRDRISPDLMITLIDDIYDVHERLILPGGIYHNKKTDSFELIMRYMRLLDWRSKETMMSRFLAGQIKNCKNYIFSVKHPYETLFKLIYTHKRKVYLSHPISEVRRLEQQNRIDEANNIKAEITEISDYLSVDFVVFQPTTIDELRIQKYSVKEEGGVETDVYLPLLTPRWEASSYRKPTNMLYANSGFNDVNQLWLSSIPEASPLQDSKLIAALASNIKLQVRVRDYALVEQSDVLVIYRPLFNGNASRSVNEEFTYHERLKEISNSRTKCIIYSPEKDINDFYVKVFNMVLKSFIDKSDFPRLKPKDHNMSHKTLISTNEGGKLKKACIDEFTFIDYFEHIIDECGLVTDYSVEAEAAMGDSIDEQFIRDFYQKMSSDLKIVDNYSKHSHFIIEEMTVSDLYTKIVDEILIK